MMGEALDSSLAPFNYRIASWQSTGKNGLSNTRVYRARAADPSLPAQLPDVRAIIEELGGTAVTHHNISPHSSKYPSWEFSHSGNRFDLILSHGANRGVTFERLVASELIDAVGTAQQNDLIEGLQQSHPAFRWNNIHTVIPCGAVTKKRGVPIEGLGRVIGDVQLNGDSESWFVSLKDVNGSTFSSFPGAATLFDAQGTLDPNSSGANFLRAFGADLNLIQDCYDVRNCIYTLRDEHPKSGPNHDALKYIFERAWGMNYFYARKLVAGWNVFWVNRQRLDELTSNLHVDEITYPTATSKSIVVKCSNSHQKYQIEVRNSSGGEYPNDIKFKVS